jgi:hypothetical protein
MFRLLVLSTKRRLLLRVLHPPEPCLVTLEQATGISGVDVNGNSSARLRLNLIPNMSVGRRTDSLSVNSLVRVMGNSFQRNGEINGSSNVSEVSGLNVNRKDACMSHHVRFQIYLTLLSLAAKNRNAWLHFVLTVK